MAGTILVMKTLLKNNGLSIAFTLLFLLSLVGHSITGYKEYNADREEDGAPPVEFPQYLHSGHFLQSTFENWESEFLQMAFFVIFTIWLRQKGSSESKGDGPEEVDREPSPDREGAPWPVRKGGIWLWLFRRSLSLVLLLLFVLSFIAHLYGSMKDENEHLLRKGLPQTDFWEHLAGSRFWFESFQNWQSEFLSVAAIVLLSVYFRQQGSSQSKPVDAPNEETGG